MLSSSLFLFSNLIMFSYPGLFSSLLLSSSLFLLSSPGLFCLVICCYLLSAATYHGGNESPNYPERERYYPGSIRRKKLHLSGLYPDSNSGALSAEGCALRSL